jgi:hypothetical protein
MSSPDTIPCDRIKENEIIRVCDTYGGREVVTHTILVGKREGNSHLKFLGLD